MPSSLLSSLPSPPPAPPWAAPSSTSSSSSDDDAEPRRRVFLLARSLAVVAAAAGRLPLWSLSEWMLAGISSRGGRWSSAGGREREGRGSGRLRVRASRRPSGCIDQCNKKGSPAPPSARARSSVLTWSSTCRLLPSASSSTLLTMASLRSLLRSSSTAGASTSRLGSSALGLRSFGASPPALAPGSGSRPKPDVHAPFVRMAPPRRASLMERMSPVDRAYSKLIVSAPAYGREEGSLSSRS